MALSAKDRRELYSSTMERLTEVIGASGKAEELVKLTTQIVQATKKLAGGTPDVIMTKSTSTLAEFVKAAKKIAQDPRAVDSVSLHQLSTTRKAVELLVKELDSWHTSQAPRDETDVSLDNILTQTSGNARPDSRSSSGRGRPVSGNGSIGGLGRTRSSPTEQINAEQEKKLLMELKRLQEELAKKAEPQMNRTSSHRNPEETLKMTWADLSSSTSLLTELAGQKCPRKEALLDPAITLAKMVCILMDLVDSLFVSKFPMRSQVHSFCCMLVENALAYGDQAKTDDMASLKLISTQVPAMMSAVDVMVEQCYKRAQNIQESQNMSLLRNEELSGDFFKASPVVKKRMEPPTPPIKKQAPPPVKEFDISVMICTSVAVDSATNSILNKGTEITLKVTPTTAVHNVRKMLAEKTNIPLENVQLRFRGDDVLTDNTLVTPDNLVPYFMFNLHEPGEEEMAVFRKEQRRKNRIRIDTNDWSRVQSPVAVAIYDYEALAEPGEEDNLEFEEGDLIEITEKSADGWWTGRIEGKVGVFPASFVEMIEIPRNKDERKKLLKRFQQGRLGQDNQNDVTPVDDVHSEPRLSESVSKPAKTGKINKVFGRSQHSSTGSDTSENRSPSPTKMPAKLERITSEPALTQTEYKEKEGKQKKRKSLFKKKLPTSTSSYMPITDDFQRSPILAYKNRENKPVIFELEEEMVAVRPSVPPPMSRPLFRPKSSPRLAARGIADSGVTKKTLGNVIKPPLSDEVGSDVLKKKARRPPPPPPPPYAKTYGAKGMQSLVKRESLEGDDRKSSDNEFRAQTLPTCDKAEVAESPPVSMTITPASPTQNLRSPTGEQNEEVPTEEPMSKRSSKSMEDLLKNLEEFDDNNSTSSLSNGFLKSKRTKEERDYATIPRDELPIHMMEEEEEEEEEGEEEDKGERVRPASVPAATATPLVLEDRPCLTPSPLGTVSSTSYKQDEKEEESSSSFNPPVKPPRSRSKRMKMKEELVKGDNLAPDLSVPSPPTQLASASPKPNPNRPRSTPLPSDPAQPATSQKYGSPKQGHPVFHRPKPPSMPPPPIENGLRQEQSKPIPAGNRPKPSLPLAPPRKNRSLKRPPKTEEETKSEAVKKPPVPAKPKPAHLARAHLGVQDGQQCSSAPVSRTPSPDDTGSLSMSGKQRSDSSTCVSNLGSSPGMRRGKGKPSAKKNDQECLNQSSNIDNKYSLSYKTAIKCILYLMSDHLVREDRLISSSSGNPVLIQRLLTSIDNAEAIDLNSLQEAPSVLSLLISLFDKSRLGYLVGHGLAEELCSSMQSADPINVLGNKLEELTPDYRDLLKKLLRLFGKILKHSHKNHTNVEHIDEVFSPLIFEDIPSTQSEPLLAYLVSTCEFVIT